ncbi:tyrosine-type recombinase/integrase [Nannocystis pusilla]|uniref:tyrosine-type recombinase/integrase n=1 Tax=Nannocystis pusilla TaxID=889268 RepID=UPI003DA6C002
MKSPEIKNSCARSRAKLQLLTPRETAHLLQISPRTLEAWRSRGAGPPWVMVGSRPRYQSADVADWISRETRGAGKRARLKKEEKKIKVRARAYKNNPNLWQVDLMFCHPQTGAEIRKRSVAPEGASFEQAIAWGEARGMELYLEACKGPKAADESQKKEEPRKKEPEGKRAPTLAALWVDFHHEYIRTQKISTQAGYRHAWKDILPIMGKIRVDKIAGSHLAKLRTQMQERGNVQSSIQQVEAKLTTCLNWAKERGNLPANHLIPKLKWPTRKEKKHVQIYTEAELELQVAAAADLEERVLILLLVDGALRIGECAGLMWSDIRWDVGMTIQRNVCRSTLQDSPKGEVGTIPLTSRLKEALQELQAERPDTKFVFIPKQRKRAYTGDQALAWIVHHIQERAGVEVRGPHRIRHSVLTHLAESGESPYALQALARHSDLQTTLTYYVHVNKIALAKQAIAALEARSPRFGKGLATSGNVVQMPRRRSSTA